jgi:phosphocarrier protein HPr
MQSCEVTICNRLGLHARAAAKLVGTASGFDAEVTLEKQGQRVNGKSIMGVMMLAASQGTVLRITAEGPGELEVLEALQELVADRFGEPE